MTEPAISLQSPPTGGQMPPPAPAIDVHGLSKSYGPTPVLRSVDFTAPAGSITAVLGASGSGKTTLLRLIAGFEDADAGTITIDGCLVDDGRRTVRPQHRSVGYVPQDAALFPHLTVAANIGFGVPRRHRRQLVAELIALVGLTRYEHRYPYQLSGGQQQRVALARALAIEPNVVLLDEPFGSLDATLREAVRADVIEILIETGTTTVLVTHDQDEALSLADHIALLDTGRIIATGNPRELYDHPPTPRIAAAIGTANILTGRLTKNRLRYALGDFPVVHAATTDADACQLLIRPEQLSISATPRPGRVEAIVRRVRYHGHDTLIDVTVDASSDLKLVARLTGQTTIEPGQHIWITTTITPHAWT
ncbi:MAG: ABC transporter ATP-binding protein [Sciscionella sp.]